MPNDLLDLPETADVSATLPTVQETEREPTAPAQEPEPLFKGIASNPLEFVSHGPFLGVKLQLVTTRNLHVFESQERFHKVVRERLQERLKGHPTAERLVNLETQLDTVQRQLDAATGKVQVENGKRAVLVAEAPDGLGPKLLAIDNRLAKLTEELATLERQKTLLLPLVSEEKARLLAEAEAINLELKRQRIGELREDYAAALQRVCAALEPVMVEALILNGTLRQCVGSVLDRQASELSKDVEAAKAVAKVAAAKK